MNTIALNGDNARISIHVCGYENVDASDVSDANWLTSEVEISVGPFLGKYGATFATQDFSDFRDELEKLVVSLNGKAVFTSDEDWLRFEVVVKSTGRASVSGEALVVGNTKASLTFSFETDQSFLQEALKGVCRTLECFPIKLM